MVDFDFAVPVFALGNRLHLAPVLEGNELGPIANPEDRLAKVVDARIDARGIRFVTGTRAAGEDDALDRGVRKQVERRRERQNLAIDGEVADPSGDQLVVLAPEIENDDFFHCFIVGRSRPKRNTEGSGNRFLGQEKSKGVALARS